MLLCLGPDVPAGRLAGCARFGAWSCMRAARGCGEEPGTPIWSRPSPCGHTPRRTASAPSIARSSGPTGSPCTAVAAGPPAGRRTWLPGGFATCTGTGGPSSASPRSTPSGIRARSRVGRRPTNGMTARFLWRVARGVLSRRVAGRLGEKQWFIAYRRVGGEASADGDSARLTMIAPPPAASMRTLFCFGATAAGSSSSRTTTGASGRAVICYVEIDEGGRHSSPQLALKQDCHLSYPFVFEEGDAVYMVPETAGPPNGRALARGALPGRMDARPSAAERCLGHGCHPGAPRREGCGCSSPSPSTAIGRSTSSSSSPPTPSSGEWEPHPMNPVVSDVRRARPAGRVFSQDGHLIRPAQDCSRSYGGRLVFNRVEALSPIEYRERPSAPSSRHPTAATSGPIPTIRTACTRSWTASECARGSR